MPANYGVGFNLNYTLFIKPEPWKFVYWIEPEYPENISELEYILNPKFFKRKRPKMKHMDNLPAVKMESVVGRNEPCPFGSGKKHW